MRTLTEPIVTATRASRASLRRLLWDDEGAAQAAPSFLRSCDRLRGQQLDLLPHRARREHVQLCLVHASALLEAPGGALVAALTLATVAMLVFDLVLGLAAIVAAP